MKRSLTLSLSAALFAVSAQASCPTFHEVKDVRLLGDGHIVRTELVEKLTDGQTNRSKREFISVVRDSIALNYGDEITMNTAVGIEDALFQVKVVLLTQELDLKGVFSTTYAVTEISTALFGGANRQNNRSYKSYTAQVITPYMGNGKYNRSCGLVRITDEKTYTN